ncbi:CPBP family intramembrane glutamic endopeptidase [Sporosarcina sp. PTS2304]|uniref:CPBP family intramembrane glutamic endopeptidase n=1 Tax=Sporosarcina sp. PTS2304 TaxID=2283194 RepID=UPI001F086718|nr:CPBP family intramembrane glutamic endopeptidase [Sporosarcina sp. PTS2304]
MYSFLQTVFSEELFFRGFLTKSFAHKFGFQLGNTIQGLLFGFVHGILFTSIVEPLGIIVIMFITTVAGYLLGWINEKQSNGSILSSWFIHGFVNMLVSTI